MSSVRPVQRDAVGTQDARLPRQESAVEPPEAGGSWDLVHAAQEGDRSAFALLYDKYVDVVFRYVLFRVGDRELAEDVTSETFLRALRRITSEHLTSKWL